MHTKIPSSSYRIQELGIVSISSFSMPLFAKYEYQNFKVIKLRQFWMWSYIVLIHSSQQSSRLFSCSVLLHCQYPKRLIILFVLLPNPRSFNYRILSIAHLQNLSFPSPTHAHPLSLTHSLCPSQPRDKNFGINCKPAIPHFVQPIFLSSPPNPLLYCQLPHPFTTII